MLDFDVHHMCFTIYIYILRHNNKTTILRVEYLENLKKNLVMLHDHVT